MLTTDRLTIFPLTTDQFDLLLRDKECLERSLGLRPSGIPLDTHTQKAIPAFSGKQNPTLKTIFGTPTG